MSCGPRSVAPQPPQPMPADIDCVCQQLLDIVAAQNEVVNGECITSCNRSIQQLVGGAGSLNNTIPLILTCQGTCAPFFGVGLGQVAGFGLGTGYSFYFRVNEVDPETCCATFLLLATNAAGELEPLGTPNPTIGDQPFTGDFSSTGVCLTFDLDCFCSVTCLDPVLV